MKLRLSTPNKSIRANLQVGGSKSESNRLLILKALYPQLKIENLSDSDDTNVLQRALATSGNNIDISHAGTAMRFLTAYFGTLEGREIRLTGSERMQQRPVQILVEALNKLGGDISYLGKEGFPPLLIRGRALSKSAVELRANVSSQYISALMLIAPKLPNGLEIRLNDTSTSVPYLEMTRSLLKKIGVECNFKKNKMKVFPAPAIPERTVCVESDWSSASYFYSIAALSETAEITLGNYGGNSLQGDAAVAEIYKRFGVDTNFSDGKILVTRTVRELPKLVELNLSDTPDIAQTIAVTCLGLDVPCKLTGLHTLKIKETDRLEALKTELEKFGAKVDVSNNSLQMLPAKIPISDIAIDTYNDHRMAMAFAPLALKTSLIIKRAEVVAKSYPRFWEDMESLGIGIEKQ